MTYEDCLRQIEDGRVVVNIGQIDTATSARLTRAAKRGEIAKWRGCWWPTPGAPWGLGPLKTCYGWPETARYFASFAEEPALR